MPDPKVLNDQLGDDLAALVRHIGPALVDAEPLTGVGYPGYEPSAFRLRFADGRILKGQHCASAQRAALVQEIAQHAHRILPAVVARSGAVLLTEWIDGQCLDSAAWLPDLLARCGAVQGILHSIPLAPEHHRSHRGVLEHCCTRLHRHLGTLVDAGILQTDEAPVILDLAMRGLPSRCTVGYVHGDFCHENLVVQPSGDIGVIDHETLDVNAHDFDLGRTWYRWPLQMAQRQAYLDGYRQHRCTDDFVQHFPFWAISGVVAGAAFRLRKKPDAASVPVGRLRALVRTLESGADNGSAALQW